MTYAFAQGMIFCGCTIFFLVQEIRWNSNSRIRCTPCVAKVHQYALVFSCYDDRYDDTAIVGVFNNRQGGFVLAQFIFFVPPAQMTARLFMGKGRARSVRLQVPLSARDGEEEKAKQWAALREAFLADRQVNPKRTDCEVSF